MTHQRHIAFTLIALPFITSPVDGQCPTGELGPPVPEENAGFGEFIDARGDVAVIGDDEERYWVYRRDGSDWVLEDEIDPDEDVFGCVAIGGETVVLPKSGEALVYRFDGAEWAFEDSITVAGGTPSGWGSDVAADGDLIVIGAALAFGEDPIVGAVVVFRWVGNAWMEEATLFASDATSGDRFGDAVDVDGNRILVGALNDDDLGDSSGAVYVFEHDGNAWIETSKILAEDGAEDDVFGFDVALRGDLAAVSAPGADPVGAAYVLRFEPSTFSWIQEAKLEPSDAEPGDDFPRSVAVGHDSVVGGAPFHDSEDAESGAAYFFRLDGDVWVESLKFGPSIDPDFFAEVATDVAVAGDSAFVCAPEADNPDNREGIVFTLAGMSSVDCNLNGATDGCDILLGISSDENDDGVPDECDTDLVFFSGPQGGSWFDGANWSTGAVPGAGDDVLILREVLVDGAGASAASIETRPGGRIVLDDGTLSTSVIFTNRGEIAGAGTIFADVLNAGLVAPVGTLTIEGALQQVGGGRVAVGVVDGASDVLSVNGTANLGGTLAVDYVIPPSPSTSAPVDVVTWASSQGQFGVIAPTGLDDATQVQGMYLIDRLRLETRAFASVEPCRATKIESEWSNAAISGDYALLGPEVYRLVDGAWQLQTVLIADDEVSESFGQAVALDGTLAVVGDPGDDTLGEDAGAAYLFRRQGLTWTQEARVLPSHVDAGGQFGIAIGVDGDRLLIGAPWESFEEGDGPGRVYFFERGLDSNAWEETADFTSSQPVDDDSFGRTVSIDGDAAIVGVLDLDAFDPFATARPGDAHVFRRDQDGWHLEAVIEQPPADDDMLPEFSILFAAEVAISGDVAAIVLYSALVISDESALLTTFVYVYRFDGGAWIREARLTPATQTTFIWDPPGTLDLDGDTIALGQLDEPVMDGQTFGAVHLFRHNGWSWNHEPLQLLSDVEDSRMGRYTRLDGDRVIATTLTDTAYIHDGAAGRDCDFNGVADSCDIANGDLVDLNDNGVPDICEPDCNGNGLPDYVDIAFGISDDLNENGIPDECTCDEDCGAPANEMVDVVDLLALLGAWGQPTGTCDITGDGIVDVADLLAMLSAWGVCAP